jgi:ABC-type nickel/cobalt efflux system permease component RcnA
MSSIESFSRVIKRVSSILIAGLGILLLLQSLGFVKHIHGGQSIIASSNAQHSSKNRFWPMALSVGIIPCPGAVILILFSLNIGIPKIGVLLAMVMAAGMTITISVVSIVTVTTKDLLSSVLPGKRVQKLFQTGFQSLGAIFILTIGTIIFLGTV